MNNGTDRAGGTLCEVAKKKPADCSWGEGLLFMLMLDFVDTASFRLPLSPAAFQRILPTSLLPISSQLQPVSSPLLHNLHDMQSDSSNRRGMSSLAPPERSH